VPIDDPAAQDTAATSTAGGRRLGRRRGGRVYLLVRKRRAFFVPIIGCVAQVALAAVAVAMELRAGPV